MKISGSVKCVVLMLGFALCFVFSDITCLVKLFVGVPCPTCGMTRALLSFVKLDFYSYFYYNAFALPVFFATGVVLFSTRLYKCFSYLIIFVLSLNLVYYVYRLSYHTIP